MSGIDVDGEVKQLVTEIKRLGTPGPDGKITYVEGTCISFSYAL